MRVKSWGVVLIIVLAATGIAAADTNLFITDFHGGYITWTNVDPSLYYSIQWKPSLTGSNDWSESYRILQDIQSSNDYVSVPIPMFVQIVGRTNQAHTLSLSADSSMLVDGYYESVNLQDIDPDLSDANIRKGATVFGVDGALIPSGGSALPADVLSGKTFYGADQSNWVLQVGTYGEFTCDPGFFNLNGLSYDGCEFWLDSQGIYVSALDGVDDATAGFGPMYTGIGNHPCQTISYGIERAVETFRTTVYVASGEYQESINIQGGISLRGGYDPVDWSRRPENGLASMVLGYSVLQHKKTISAQNVNQPLIIEGFTLFGQPATQSGGNSYIVWMKNCSSAITISNTIFIASKGADGANGSHGINGPNGQDGSPGLDAVAPYSSRSGGSGGIRSCGATFVNGGDGGGSITPPSYNTQTSALNGSNGEGPTGGAGGSGGYDGIMEAPALFRQVGRLRVLPEQTVRMVLPAEVVLVLRTPAVLSQDMSWLLQAD